MENSQLPIDLPASISDVCPHLGLKEDAQTCMGYPSTWNFCHHCKPAVVILLNHQHHVCLTSTYMTCPVFQTPVKMHMPRQYRDSMGRR
jgi:hypothetical protein